ncbi:putative metallohydrolase (TIGR04338 family) [Kineosphaera limosa]|uniref:TIGR04338 family metallohydrolase n=1 Tax=Kineosphaera limosa NBRC 100340 TaxID=1184609 RepID=K6XAP6_9MICO|nr:TIGR04338 family metallohydrolase [Kineosphaera limosa]NYD99773.1 putative metallohydrolase (TIGR04338 family) [Kineosphaera limosa]GAB95874.1 hypothetical protein KILIM_028_00280 [Kineosphaera limosa NBRC 100340]
MSTPDPDRDAVYAAEDRLVRWSALTAELGSVRVFGSAWTPEPEVVFGRVEDIGPYCAGVLDHIGHPHPVTVRARRGATSAHYEEARAVIAIPSARVGGQWAMREFTVLHELAHHVASRPGAPEVAGHGPVFRAALLDLLRQTGHPIAATMLGIAYADEGLG